MSEGPHRRAFRLREGSEPDHDAVDEEVRYHLERKVEKLVAAGMPEEAAREEALRRFGDVDGVKAAMERETDRREARMRMRDRFDHLRHDLAHAIRQIAGKPGFAIVTVLTLVLGIGATTAIFSVVDGVLFRPLPYEEPEELVRLWSDYTGRGGPETEWPNFPNLWDLRKRSRTLEDVAIWGTGSNTVTGIGAAEQVRSAGVDHHLLGGVLRVEPELGRGFGPEDDRPGAAATVILSHGYWQRAFGGDPSAIGSTLTIDGEPYAVIGVLPASFRPSFTGGAELWIPLRMDRTEHVCGRGNACLFGIARLAEGVSLETARLEAEEIARQQAAEDPEANAGVTWYLRPLQEDIVDPARDGLLVLLAASGCVLLIACVNLANLLLARGITRRGELAVRAALGAGRRRIVGQLLTESLVLALLGGVVAIPAAYLLTDGLVALARAGTPRIDEVSVDGRVLLFAAGITLASGLVFGLFPALRAADGQLHDALRAGGRGAGAAGLRARSVLVGAQVAVALVLLVGSGLLLRTLGNLRSVDLGFDPSGVLSLRVSLPQARYADGAAILSFQDGLEERLAAIPGVASVGSTSNLPLAGVNSDVGFTIEGRPLPPPTQPQGAWYRRVSPGLLETLRIPVVRGRGVLASDDAQAPRVVVINETFAERYFAGEDPLGQRVNFNDPAEPVWWEIVGVAGDVKQFGLREGGERVALYVPFAQMPTRNTFLALRSERDPGTLAGEVRAVLADIDPQLAAAAVDPLDRYVDAATGSEQFLTALLALFAGVALALAVVGLYGVVSYSVAARLREMGVRLALGASGRSVGFRVVLQSLGVVAVGLAVGGVAAAALAPLLESLLFGLSPTDPVTFLVVAATLAAAAALAALVPALRAARVDPVEVLRAE